MTTFTRALMAAAALAILALSGSAHAAGYYYTPIYSVPAASTNQSAYVRVCTPTGCYLVPRQTYYSSTASCPTGTCAWVKPAGGMYQTYPINQGYPAMTPSPPVYQSVPSTGPGMPVINNDSPFYDDGSFNVIPSSGWNSGFGLPSGQIGKPVAPIVQPALQSQPVLDSPFYP